MKAGLVKLLFICLAVLFVNFVSVADDEEERIRFVINIADTNLSSEDSILVLPIYFSNLNDTIAGVELHLSIPENQTVSFYVDDVSPDGLIRALDTTGTLISGWELIAINPAEATPFDFKFAAMADWPGGNITPPLMPQKGGIVAKLVFKVDNSMPFALDSLIEVKLELEQTSFADYKGNSVGIVVEFEKRCFTYTGDTCLSWKMVGVGKLNKKIVDIDGGNIMFENGQIKDSLK